jgi:tetratricopeptide (TPR) repeat protein
MPPKPRTNPRAQLQTSSKHDPLSNMRLWTAALIFILTFCAFIPAINAGFSGFDDYGLLMEETNWRGIAPSNLAWMFSFESTRMGHYQPLTWLTYGIDFTLWGMNAAGYHVVNILFHSANAVLMFFLALQLWAAARVQDPRSSPARPAPQPADWTMLCGAALGTLLWSIHPLRAESVAWITERRDVVSGFFLLLTTLVYVRAFPPGSIAPTSPRLYWWSVGLLLLSLLAKAWGMSFFVIALVLDLYPLRRLPALRPWHWVRREFRPVLIQKIQYAALGMLFASLAAYAQGSMMDTVRPLAKWGVADRLLQAAYGLMFYTWKTVWPTRLAALYELPIRISATEPRFIVAYFFLAAALTVLVVLRRRIPILLAAAAIYAITLAPVLGIFQSGIQFVADRYSYLSCIGWSLLAGAGISLLLSRAHSAPSATRPVPPSARRVAIAAVLLVAPLMVLTWRQSGFWADTEGLFHRVLDLGYDGPVLRNSYGRKIEIRSREAQGDEKRRLQHQALEQFDIAVRLDPTDGSAWYARANLQRDMGLFTDAVASYREAVKYQTDPWQSYLAAGVVELFHLNHPQEALPLLKAAVDEVEKPNRPRGSVAGGGGLPYLNLAAALDMTGNPKASREMLIKAAQYPQVRENALERLAEVETEIREQK